MVRKQTQRKRGERTMLNLIASLPKPLNRFLDKFDHLFTEPQFRQFKRYVPGLFLELKRTNIQTIDTSHVKSRYHRLHHYLSESSWDPLKINSHRLKELHRSRQTKSCRKGALIIDDTDNLKTGQKTEGAKEKFPGSQGRPANCNIAVTIHYVDQVKDFPVDLEPYVPADEFPDGKEDPDFRSKHQLARELVKRALKEGIFKS